MHLQENPEASEEAVPGGKARKHLSRGERWGCGQAALPTPCCLMQPSVRNILEHKAHYRSRIWPAASPQADLCLEQAHVPHPLSCVVNYQT